MDTRPLNPPTPESERKAPNRSERMPIDYTPGPSSWIEYGGLRIEAGAEGKWYVLDIKGHVNVLPGATYGRSEQEAMMLADVLLAVDRDAQKFWHLLRAIQRGNGSLR